MSVATDDQPPGRAELALDSDPLRVARIRRELAAGTYHVDLDRLAEALLTAGALDPERTP